MIKVYKLFFNMYKYWSLNFAILDTEDDILTARLISVVANLYSVNIYNFSFEYKTQLNNSFTMDRITWTGI